MGLTVSALEALRLLTTTYAQRSAWQRYEARLQDAPRLSPMRYSPGIWRANSLAALVLQGTGTAMGLDGMPQPVSPRSNGTAGARLYGGPFELRLQAGESFQGICTHSPPFPPTPSIFDRYLAAMGPVSSCMPWRLVC